MANITAADVNKLRKQTGAGMMDCKKALRRQTVILKKQLMYSQKRTKSGRQACRPRGHRRLCIGRYY